MKVGVIILSRFNSSRLPGKALMEINNKKVLEYIVERCAMVFDKANIVIATSNELSDEPIANFAQKSQINLFRGSLNNVAERFYEAGKNFGFNYAIRVNGDNIFLDIPLLALIKELSETGNFDLISNVKDRTYPKGMSIESVNLSHYEELLKEIKLKDYYKEHVTIYLYEHLKANYHFIYNETLPEASGIQMALDDKNDWERTSKIMSRFTKHHTQYNLKEIFSIYQDIKQ